MWPDTWCTQLLLSGCAGAAVGPGAYHSTSCRPTLQLARSSGAACVQPPAGRIRTPLDATQEFCLRQAAFAAASRSGWRRGRGIYCRGVPVRHIICLLAHIADSLCPLGLKCSGEQGTECLEDFSQNSRRPQDARQKIYDIRQGCVGVAGFLSPLFSRGGCN